MPAGRWMPSWKSQSRSFKPVGIGCTIRIGSTARTLETCTPKYYRSGLEALTEHQQNPHQRCYRLPLCNRPGCRANGSQCNERSLLVIFTGFSPSPKAPGRRCMTDQRSLCNLWHDQTLVCHVDLAQLDDCNQSQCQHQAWLT